MNDIFGKRIRRFICWEEYRQHCDRQAQETLIDADELDSRVIAERIASLEKLERDFGFVYLGEKLWLQSYQQGLVRSYAEWVKASLIENVFPNGVEENEYPEEAKWHLYTENMDCLWLTKRKWFRSWIEIGDVALHYISVLLPGDDCGPTPNQWTRSFQVLHDINYYIRIVADAVTTKRREDLSICGIVVQPNGRDWEAEISGTYGPFTSVWFNDDQFTKQRP